ncbi:M48 family metallopeptidase [Achromobacter sp. GG226]|uniref:M48 family metallopeptidase n=1 Tax=Verticiella alkaliphila TaxID=2779529 RepID=UPI001C0B1135|nr:M48 family metallopeptidase [Verticiella sp. GG226]MBU4609317.1 M48 family metallopeptidase [Verticiella sp. GG226]
MDFFEQQALARRRSALLVGLMAVAVICLVSVTSFVIALIIGWMDGGGPDRPELDWMTRTLSVVTPGLLIGVAIPVLTVIVVAGLFKHYQLAGGGVAVAEALGGRRLDPGSTEPEARKVLNVVEEMALASGIAVPPVYVLEDPAINAFAAGYSPRDAVIGVTRGSLQHLTRDELQGVIAHEFSHIFHGDMRLNTRLVSVLHGILVIGLVGRGILEVMPWRRGNNSRDNAGPQLLVIALVLVVLGSIGTLFGRIIKAAVSRQREFLADAAAVQFTRNPDGIAGALKKIGAVPAGSRVKDAHAHEFSHMFFSKAVGRASGAWMSTHPPLVERIRRIEPGWDGRFPTLEEIRARQAEPPRDAAQTPAADARLERAAAVLTPAAALAAIDAIGQADPAHLAQAQRTLEDMDPALRDAAHDTYVARAVIYALLLSDSSTVQERQLQALSQQAHPDVQAILARLREQVLALPESARLPLLESALPALRQLSAAQYDTFKGCLRSVIQADGQVSLREWAFYRIVVHTLESRASPRTSGDLASNRRDVAILMGALARAGEGDGTDSKAAFAAGAVALGMTDLEPPITGAGSPHLLDEAVSRLAGLETTHKKPLLRALAQVVTHTGEASPMQAELLRAVALALDCPLPPLVSAAPA